MSRVEGASNIVAFVKRTKIATTSTKTIKHLARAVTATPCEQFKATLRHQNNYLDWIDSRHHQLIEAKAELHSEGRGPKDATYRKYQWYAEQVTLLEAINAFEVFYKTTFINLARALRRFIPPDRITGSVDAKVLWINQGKTSFPALIFEHRLYHDLEQVDRVSAMLVDARRYTPNSVNSARRDLVVALQAIFQIRHTLSHNQGRITQSDKAKLRVFGYSAKSGEVIDPSKEHLGRSIRTLLEMEANEFSDWILESTAHFLQSRSKKEDMELSSKLKEQIEKLVGKHASLERLDWKEV